MWRSERAAALVAHVRRRVRGVVGERVRRTRLAQAAFRHPVRAGVAGVGLLLGTLLWLAGGSDVTALDVERGELRLTVEVEGELAAVRAVSLGPPPVNVYGELKIAFLVPEGTQVKTGQPVLGFDTQALARSLEQKQAELAETTKKVEEKEIDTQVKLLELEQRRAQSEALLRKARLKAEVPEDLMARIDARKSALDVQVLEAEVASIEAEIASLRASGEAETQTLLSHQQRAAASVASLARDIGAMTVVAPQDGIVLYKSDWNDVKPKVGDSVWALQRVVTLPDLSEMRGAGTVDEADGGAVRVGQPVTLRLEARPDLDLHGKVTSIGRTVQRKSWRVPAKVYRVEIALDRSDPTVMRPAMRFRGEIEVARVPDVLLVPPEAVFMRPSGPVAWVRRAWGYVETPVKLGRRDRRRVEVVEGLSEGERLSATDLATSAAADQHRSAREAL